MKIKLSDHFTYGRLLRFTLPSVVMMVIASIYSVVDGLFVSNLVGDMALSAVNIIFPVAMIIGAFGFMLGTGGSAIVARTLGEGRRELAQRYFSMIIYAVILLGGVLTVVSVWLTEPIARRAGASDALIRDCVVYGRILLLGSVPFMLQVCFQSFFVVAERPQLGLAYSIAAGVPSGDRRGGHRYRAGVCCGRHHSAVLFCHGGAFRPAADQEPALSQAAASGVQQRLIRTDEQHLLLGDQHFV